MIYGVPGVKQVNPPDHVVDAANTQPSHNLPQFLRHHEEIVHQMLRPAGEFLAQFRVLGGDAHRTGVEMAFAHHYAAQAHKGRGGETELLGPQQDGDGQIPPGFELAVGLQHHPRAQVVLHQSLMGFGQAQLPGHTGVFDGGEGGGAGAAVMTGDNQMIRPRLGDAGGYGAHAYLRAEFDADAGVWVGVLQVVNELGYVLYGIDVVVRGRADEAHAGGGMTDAGDVAVHLVAGQFAALAGLGALHYLYLQLIGVG